MNWYKKSRLSCNKFWQKIAQTAAQEFQTLTEKIKELQEKLPPQYSLQQKPNGMWVVIGDTGIDKYELVHDEPTPEQAISLALQRIALLSALNKYNIKIALNNIPNFFKFFIP